MATKKRMKRFDDGGMTSNSNYPFGQGQSQMQAPAQDAGGLGNTSPLVQVNATPFGMKKGGSVSTSKVKKMAVGGMGGMERKPIGGEPQNPGRPGADNVGMERKPIGGSTVLPTPPRGPKGPATELKPIGPAKPMPGFTGAPNISGSPNGMPTRGPGSSGSFMGGMERKPIGGTSPAFGGAKINPITEKVTHPAFGFGEKPTLGTGPVGTSPAPVGIGAIGSRIGSLMGGMKKGGAVKKMASGGSASSRADGIAQKGKTRGKMR